MGSGPLDLTGERLNAPAPVLSIANLSGILYKYLSRVYFGCKTKLCLTVPGTYGNIFLHKKVSIHIINKQDTSFPDCKHKHYDEKRSST